MNPITRISKKKAMALIGVKNKQTFSRYAKLLDFTEYPGLRSSEYSREDVIRKWNMTKDQVKRKLLNQQA